MNLLFKTIKEIRNIIDTRVMTVNEIRNEINNNISKINPSMNAIIENFSDSTYNKDNISSLLYGIPFLSKDNILQQAKIASAGSQILKNHMAAYSSTVITRLQSAGAYNIGRANCDEFAMGSSGETSWYGPVKNPWDLSRVPGGSSSGSAAAVAAGIVPFALGTETGGSVRQPASLCGIVGLKTTYGLHSRFGIIAYASSLDQIGIFTRNVEDMATVLSVTAGHDPFDNTTTNKFDKYDYNKNLNSSVAGKKIAIITNALYADGVCEKVKANLLEAIATFKSLGVEIKEITLDTMEYSAALYFIISRAEAASNLSRFDGVKYGFRSSVYDDLKSMYEHTREEGFGYTVKRRIIVGNYVLAAEHADEYYNRAKRIQSMMQDEFKKALTDVDALFCPVSPDVAFKLGAMVDNPLAIDLQDYFTAAANLVGIPALALPSGLIDGLPVGFQLMGNFFDEEVLLQLGQAYQKATSWHQMKPNMENYNEK
jgi:aspartyl-tRNA(Asn)/glutamyl-tRNA(Gln) amidotransferase subunit A